LPPAGDQLNCVNYFLSIQKLDPSLENDEYFHPFCGQTATGTEYLFPSIDISLRLCGLAIFDDK